MPFHFSQSSRRRLRNRALPVRGPCLRGRSLGVQQVLGPGLPEGVTLRSPAFSQLVEGCLGDDRLANRIRAAEAVEMLDVPLELVRVNPADLVDDLHAGAERIEPFLVAEKEAD